MWGRRPGTSCPGLAIGYRMACAGLEALNAIRSEDEEIVAVVENDACGVDALQCVTGCTFGKGNLVFHDHGKQVYTLYSRRTGRGVRVVFHGKGATGQVRQDRDGFAQWIMTAPVDEMLSVRKIQTQEPEPARILDSVPCNICGESVMETRLRQVNGRGVCIPCAEGIGNR